MSKPNLVLRAQKFCEANKYRFTEPRERVLSLLANCDKPMGAYQILESLSYRKGKISPPTIYRAIDFWSEHGFIHRVESMNAYIACCRHKEHENFCIFICDKCSTVLELQMKNLAQITSDFIDKRLTATRFTTEIHGKCSQCDK